MQRMTKQRQAVLDEMTRVRGFRSAHRGNGLGGLEARVAESGGTLTITSDSSGTELNITMDTP